MHRDDPPPDRRRRAARRACRASSASSPRPSRRTRPPGRQTEQPLLRALQDGDETATSLVRPGSGSRRRRCSVLRRAPAEAPALAARPARGTGGRRCSSRAARSRSILTHDGSGNGASSTGGLTLPSVPTVYPTTTRDDHAHRPRARRRRRPPQRRRRRRRPTTTAPATTAPPPTTTTPPTTTAPPPRPRRPRRPRRHDHRAVTTTDTTPGRPRRARPRRPPREGALLRHVRPRAPAERQRDRGPARSPASRSRSGRCRSAAAGSRGALERLRRRVAPARATRGATSTW